MHGGHPILLDISAGQYSLFGLLTMLGIGGGLGAILYVASRFFKVDIDPRIEKILEALPNVNCGACGFGGCAAYAESVVLKGVGCALCAPGGTKIAATIADIMGSKAERVDPLVAVVHCGGGNETAKKAADYYGIQSCQSVCVPGANSPKACTYGCLGFGDCEKACKFDALVMGKDGLPQIIESNCIACGACVRACPRKLIELHTRKSLVHVLCKNCDKGKDTKAVCEVGCIACKKCEKICPVDAIHVINNLAVIEYTKCISCGKCVKECPQNIIVNWRKIRKDVEKLKQPEPAQETQPAIKEGE